LSRMPYVACVSGNRLTSMSVLRADARKWGNCLWYNEDTLGEHRTEPVNPGEDLNGRTDLFLARAPHPSTADEADTAQQRRSCAPQTPQSEDTDRGLGCLKREKEVRTARQAVPGLGGRQCQGWAAKYIYITQ
jgi:hypothetical protein